MVASVHRIVVSNLFALTIHGVIAIGDVISFEVAVGVVILSALRPASSIGRAADS